ncbi:hypothetical protein RMSM_03926 [Rhodopirellula maiorica SM1]|uniref:Uncharacterized protein n=1 Tax=Rhodopirellula maiorica SM1 TaxID=1265738 RepID=M5RZ01_9BACT|nr:hypothetical protein RMSM_03926 [Rhodopirellula maiorica SM1]
MPGTLCQTATLPPHITHAHSLGTSLQVVVPPDCETFLNVASEIPQHAKVSMSASA